MSDDPAATVIDDGAVDVAATAAAYEADVERFEEKFTRSALADDYGDEFTARLPDDARILDVGCGPGADSAVFADAGDDVVGFDLSESLLHAASDGVDDARFVRGDMRALPFAAGAFDGLWSSASFLHVAREHAPETLAEFARVLGDEGVLFLSVLAREPRDVDAVETPDGRQFTLWARESLVDHFVDAGFAVVWDSEQTDWHALVAVRE